MKRKKQMYDMGTVILLEETPKAICIQVKNRDLWLPKSQCEIYEWAEGPFQGTPALRVAMWLAVQERLLY